jgi:hypothetical protein
VFVKRDLGGVSVYVCVCARACALCFLFFCSLPSLFRSSLVSLPPPHTHTHDNHDTQPGVRCERRFRKHPAIETWEHTNTRRGTQITCLTSTKVQKLTPEELCREAVRCQNRKSAGSKQATSLLLLQKYPLYQYKSTNPDSSGAHNSAAPR